MPPPSVPGLAARIAAARLLGDVATGVRPLDERIEGEGAFAPYAALGPRDRTLARSIVVASLRRMGYLRKVVGAKLDRGMPKKSGGLEWILVAGAAQLLLMEQADHAAVDLSVRAAKADPNAAPYAALVNAVLRAIQREGAAALDACDPLDDGAPPWLAARWRATYGEDSARAIAAMHLVEPTLDVTVKSDPEGWAEKLDGVALPGGSVRLRGHAPIADMPGYADGEWWVQDAAAALAARIVAAKPGERIADLCAAPGGKTAWLAHCGADVVAVEKSAERMRRLAENFGRLRLSADLRIADALTFDAPRFDAVLLDAPCTATGTIRRHPDVAWTKKPGDVAALADRQEKLLDRAARLVKPGGRLVHCVCSLEPEEGERQVARLLRRDPELRRAPVTADEARGFEECLTPEGDVRSLPFHLKGATPRLSGVDGFYVARLVRSA
ncbi:MAG: RsmB/NOP family class I SAM-dependent RNA methyltransferase [Hyphomicrobiales bacterium]|nr:RsmB/NOP family class I SAM-dependent RNA methyltransferase [Hyphomicrobiales bacterium]MDE2017296.1 RsmB/NOP family class I SAM-dependent RNA methyltransferase [Hyphomicrobiales bacterium]